MVGRCSLSSVAATSSRRCAASGSTRTRVKNADSTLSDKGRASGSGSVPASWPAVSPRGSSSNASGLPPVCSTSCSRTAAATGRPAPSSRDAAAARSSPPSVTDGNPVPSSPPRSAVLVPARIAIPSAPSRLATNKSASADAASSQCASSIRHNSGPSSAAAASNDRQPANTRNRSLPPSSDRPSARPSARPCGAGISGSRSRIGPSSWCRAAYGSSDSDATPRAARTRIPSARARASANRAVFPAPGSPRMIRTRLSERRAASRSSATRTHSASRPWSISEA